MAEEQDLPLEFTPMSDAYAEPPKEEKTYESDMDGIQDAANELERTRAEKDDIVERKYVTIGGPDHGKPIPENQSIDLKRAVDDLTRQRGFEAEAAEHDSAQALAEATDQYRAEQQQAQVNAQPQQPQAEPQPQPQIPADQVPEGVDPEIVDALTRSPKLRAAVEAELGKANSAREAYATATREAAQISLAAVLAQYPEISGLSAEQLPTALQMMAAQNPQRAADAVASLQRAEQIYRLHQQAQGAQAQVMAAQIQHWSHQQDQAFEQSVAHEPVETRKAVESNLVRVARDAYGIDPAELRAAFSAHPILRAAPFQKLIYSAVKAHLAQEQVAQKKIPASIPNVQRPGTSSDRPSPDEAAASRAYQKFISDPNPRSAAAFIVSKRSARR